MKRIIGIMISVLGLLFLLKPDFDLVQNVEVLFYMLYTYWPIFLICFGIYLQSSSLHKKRTK